MHGAANPPGDRRWSASACTSPRFSMATNSPWAHLLSGPRSSELTAARQLQDWVHTDDLSPFPVGLVLILLGRSPQAGWLRNPCSQKLGMNPRAEQATIGSIRDHALNRDMAFKKSIAKKKIIQYMGISPKNGLWSLYHGSQGTAQTWEQVNPSIAGTEMSGKSKPIFAKRLQLSL